MSTETRTDRPARLTATTGRPNLVLLGAVAVVFLAGLAALIVTLLDDGTAEATNFDTAVATVQGTALDPLTDRTDDSAVGEPAPVIEGLDLEGTALRAPASGRPTVLLFLAHWCPHCQAEVPVVQDWVDAGNLPEGVDLIAVATAMSSNRPNYPPAEWLTNEQWTVPTLADASSSAAIAYGLSKFPFWVAVDADGTMVERRSGELTAGQISELVAVANG